MLFVPISILHQSLLQRCKSAVILACHADLSWLGGPGVAGGMVALPAAAFQHMLAAHTQRMQEAAKMMAAGEAPVGMQQPAAALKAPGSGELLPSAAVLYMNPSDLDVSSDASKRPVAA
jgi:hypothetical protein